MPEGVIDYYAGFCDKLSLMPKSGLAGPILTSLGIIGGTIFAMNPENISSDYLETVGQMSTTAHYILDSGMAVFSWVGGGLLGMGIGKLIEGLNKSDYMF